MGFLKIRSGGPRKALSRTRAGRSTRAGSMDWMGSFDDEAERALGEGDARQVAARLGYELEASLGRAFKGSSVCRPGVRAGLAQCASQHRRGNSPSPGYQLL